MFLSYKEYFYEFRSHCLLIYWCVRFSQTCPTTKSVSYPFMTWWILWEHASFLNNSCAPEFIIDLFLGYNFILRLLVIQFETSWSRRFIYHLKLIELIRQNTLSSNMARVQMFWQAGRPHVMIVGCRGQRNSRLEATFFPIHPLFHCHRVVIEQLYNHWLSTWAALLPLVHYVCIFTRPLWLIELIF